MSRTAKQLRDTIANAHNTPVTALPGISAAQAHADRAEAIADLETQLKQREAEESGSWTGSGR